MQDAGATEAAECNGGFLFAISQSQGRGSRSMAMVERGTLRAWAMSRPACRQPELRRTLLGRRSGMIDALTN
jgi:hypothetical protein